MTNQPYSSPGRETQKFKLPKLEFESNQSQLDSLKKKLLANSYNRQIQNKEQHRRETTATTKKSSENPESSEHSVPNYIDINMAYIDHERKVKHELAKEYEKQMERKQSLERLERERKMDEERKMIESLKEMNKIQEERSRINEISYRRQMTEQIEAARRREISEMEKKSKQKQQFNRKYSPLTRNYGFNQNPKLNKFKEHFDHVNRIQFKIEKNFMDNWGPMIKEKQHQKERLIEAGISKVHNFQKILNQRNEENERRHRNEYKEALLRQIKQKQQIKSLQKARHKKQAYTSGSYKNLHHPIYNPVDFKMAHDNKRVLKELKQEQELENRMSGLARNGSLVMMPSYHTE